MPVGLAVARDGARQQTGCHEQRAPPCTAQRARHDDQPECCECHDQDRADHEQEVELGLPCQRQGGDDIDAERKVKSYHPMLSGILSRK